MNIPMQSEIRAMSDEDLMNLVRNNGRPGLGLPQQALDELQYRYSVQSRNHLEQLGASICTLAAINDGMRVATEESAQQVKRLADSSDKVEKLTQTLNNLTLALLFLTILAVIVPIAIEVWKATRELHEPLPPIVVQFPPPTSPQTSAHPAP
jgi:hypothetical protein